MFIKKKQSKKYVKFISNEIKKILRKNKNIISIILTEENKPFINELILLKKKKKY